MKKGFIFLVNVAALFMITCFVIQYPVTANASPGSIDLSFGTAGKVKTDFNSSQDQATASAIYKAGTHAGKIVVAGMVMNASNYDTFGVARYNTNGTLDTTFDTDGKAPTVDLTGYFSRPWGVAIQSDDKIVVAGVASWGSPTNRNDLGVVRYNANGSLDTTFDGDGKVTMQIGSLNSSWQAVAVQSDGKILIAGQSYSGGDVSTIVRLNTNGSYDTSFTINAGGTYESFNAIAVQSDGKILAAGYGYDGSQNKMTVVRLTSAGALDTSFNGTGIQLLSGSKAFGTGGESANSLALQSDGKILVGGTTDVSGQTAFAVARLNTDGSLDTTFNSTGKTILDPTTGSDYLKGIGVQTDGKIVLSGYGYGTSGNFDFLSARLNSGGTIDTSFGLSGYVFVDFGDDDRGDAGLVIQSDNNSVIAGWSGPSSAARDFALVRLNASSTNMVYASSTVSQNTNVIAPGATGDIVNIAITMNGDLSALTATSFTCNTTGTTATADISSARLYYTGTTAAFSTATPFGSAVASPSGSFTITGTQTLAEGMNYFWLAYTVASGATNGNILDAECTSVTVGGTARTPSLTAPAGNRQIFNILAIYDIGTHVPVQSGGPNYVVPGSVAPGITATNLTAGPSMTTDTYYTDTGSYLFMSWTTSTSNDAGQYLQAKITPGALKQITYSKVAFAVAADNYASGTPQYYGPTTIDLRYSTDDFASSNVLLQTLTWTPTAESFQQVPFDVDISSIGTRSGPITFRWYGYKRNAAGDTTSTMGFTNLPSGGQAAASGTGSNVIFKGTVSSTNTAPTFVGATTTLTVNQNSGATDIKGLLHVSDTDSSQAETWSQSLAPGHGTLSFTGATAVSGTTDITPGGTITYTPTPGYSGSDSFTVQVSDGTATATRTITVTVVPPPTVTDARISISGASGTGGAFKIGDTVTATWNNTAGGDNNSGITGVTVDFSQFGGGSAVAATNSSNTWTVSYTIVSGSIDNTNRNVSVTATNSAGSTTTSDTTNATVDNITPTVTDAGISISGASGTGGAFRIGDIVTATWNNTAGGDNNADTISGVTVDFSAFGGGAAVSASNSSGTWTATYTIVSGAIDGTNRNISVTATDNTGNTTTTADTTNAMVDNIAPTVTDAMISISGASGIGGAFKIGDTITATWNNTAGGDNNADTISSVTVDFSAFGGGAAVAASNSSNTWTATHTIDSGVVDGINKNVAVTATDNASNAASAADTSNAVVSNTVPVADPATLITVSSFTANWAALSGATGYFLDVATDSGFTGPVIGYNNRDAGNTLNLSVTGLTPGLSYYYRVRAYDASGTSGYSNTIQADTFPGTVYSIVVDPTDQQYIVAGTDGAGVYISTDSGVTWNAADNQPSNLQTRKLVVHPTTVTTLYAATYGGGIFVSTDRASTWTACTGQPANLNLLSLAIASDGRLYCGTEAGVYSSSDCTSWEARNSGLPAVAGVLVIDPGDQQKLIAGLDGSGIYLSSNGGTSWTAATNQPGNTAVRAIVLKPGDNTKLYAGTYGGGVFKSTNSGVDWSICANTNLTNLNVVSLTIDSTGKLYAGTEAGVFVSSDNCTNWVAINNGLPN